LATSPFSPTDRSKRGAEELQRGRLSCVLLESELSSIDQHPQAQHAEESD